MSATERVYLIVSADRRVRVAKRLTVRADEVAIAVNLRYPPGWGHVVHDLTIDVPDFAPTSNVDAEPSAAGQP